MGGDWIKVPTRDQVWIFNCQKWRSESVFHAFIPGEHINHCPNSDIFQIERGCLIALWEQTLSGTIFGTIECEDRNKLRHIFFQGQEHLLERSSQKHTYFCDVVSFAPLLWWWGEKGEGEGLCIKTTLFIYDSQEPKGDEAEWSGRNDFPKILVSLHKPTVAGRSIWWKEWVGEVLIATLFLWNFVFWETITNQNRTANPGGGELCIGETNKEIREPLRRRSSAAIEHRTACCGYTGSVGYARVIVGSYFRFFKTNMPVCAQGWNASPFKCLRWKSYTIVCNCIKQGYFVVFHHPLEQWFSTWGSWTLLEVNDPFTGVTLSAILRVR